MSVPVGSVDHRDVEHALVAARWTPYGAGGFGSCSSRFPETPTLATPRGRCARGWHSAVDFTSPTRLQVSLAAISAW